MGNFNIKEFLTENKLTDTSKRLDEGWKTNDVEGVNKYLRDIQSGKDAKELVTDLWNRDQDKLLAYIILHADTNKFYDELAKGIKQMVDKAPPDGPFDHIPK